MKFQLYHLIIGVIIFAVLNQTGIFAGMMSAANVGFFAVDDIKGISCDANSTQNPSCYDKGGLGTISCKYDVAKKGYYYDTTYCVDTEPIKQFWVKYPWNWVRTHPVYALGGILFFALVFWVWESEEVSRKPSMFDKIRKWFEKGD